MGATLSAGNTARLFYDPSNNPTAVPSPSGAAGEGAVHEAHQKWKAQLSGTTGWITQFDRSVPPPLPLLLPFFLRP